MRKLLKEDFLKKKGKFISQVVNKVLKNIGKFSNFVLTSKEEYRFFCEIKPVITKKFKCRVEIVFEVESKDQKAIQALPGKPALLIS